MLCLCHVEAQQISKVSASLTEKHAQKFRTAEDIQWNRTDRLAYAQFSYQDHFWVAYYDNNEQLVATARKITDLRSLPIGVAESLEDFRQHRAMGNRVALIYELLQQGCTRYLITLDGEQETYSLIVDSMGGRTNFNRTRKDDSTRKSDKADLIAKNMRR